MTPMRVWNMKNCFNISHLAQAFVFFLTFFMDQVTFFHYNFVDHINIAWFTSIYVQACLLFSGKFYLMQWHGTHTLTAQVFSHFPKLFLVPANLSGTVIKLKKLVVNWSRTCLKCKLKVNYLEPYSYLPKIGIFLKN